LSPASRLNSLIQWLTGSLIIFRPPTTQTGIFLRLRPAILNPRSSILFGKALFRKPRRFNRRKRAQRKSPRRGATHENDFTRKFAKNRESGEKTRISSTLASKQSPLNRAAHSGMMAARMPNPMTNSAIGDNHERAFVVDFFQSDARSANAPRIFQLPPVLCPLT
jgi:hypothetical protein